MTLPNRPGYHVNDKKGVNQAYNSPPPVDSSNRAFVQPPFHNSGADPLFNALFTQLDPKLDGKGNLSIPSFDSLESPKSFSNGGIGRILKNFQPSMESLSIEEMHNRKKYIKQHRLLSNTIELLSSCQKEGLLPSLDPLVVEQSQQPTNGDFGLDEFLSSQGIEDDDLSDEEKTEDRTEFLSKLDQLKEKYKEELEKLNQVCTEFCQRMLHLMREQSQIRPVTEAETQLKMIAIQQKFDHVKGQLRQNACSTIQALQKRYGQTKRRKRTLPKKATDALSNWFYEHLTDPYPTEEDKNILASSAGLTLTQVNNWFGNKRIRYKRKLQEAETRKDSKVAKRDGEYIPKDITH